MIDNDNNNIKKIVLNSSGLINRSKEFFSQRFDFIKTKGKDEFYIFNIENNTLSQCMKKSVFFFEIKSLIYKYNVMSKNVTNAEIEKAFLTNGLIVFVNSIIENKKSYDLYINIVEKKNNYNYFNSGMCNSGNYLEIF